MVLKNQLKSKTMVENLQNIFKQKGYTWDKDINIIGMRNKSTNKVTNKFDDVLYVAYNYMGISYFKEFAITTDPGKYYMQIHLLNPLGTAILVEGQYVNIYGIRLHQGKYEALCQTWGAVKLFRDGNLNDIYDFVNEMSDPNSGINIHCAGEDSINIDNWSAGCQVFKRKKDFLEFMRIVNLFKSSKNNKFTYTLI